MPSKTVKFEVITAHLTAFIIQKCRTNLYLCYFLGSANLCCQFQSLITVIPSVL